MIPRQPMGTTVLVVEPNPSARAMLQLLLTQHGYTVTHADTFAAALAAFTQETHTLVIAAERLGNRSGLELIQILHTRPHAPGGIIVGQRSLQRAQVALRSGVDEYVARPIDEADLLLACEHARAIHLERAERALLDGRSEQLQTAFVQVLQTIGMDVQRRLAGAIAHEINNPLTPILGQAELLRDEFASGDPRRTQVDAILAAVRRIRTVIQQMLSYARPPDQQRMAFDLVGLLQNILLITGERLRNAGIHVTFTASSSSILINGNIQQITDALFHLIDNAYEAMPNGGTLSLTLRVEAAPIGGSDGASFVQQAVIDLQDTGGGIAPQHQPYIFDLFYSTKVRSSPHGAGLALSQSIIVAHNGTLTFTTQVGVGSTFRVTLPLQPDST